jgi:DNA polymerase-3 subunit gamma/tau
MKSLRSVKALEEAVSTAKEATIGQEIQITINKDFTFGMAKGVLMELARQRTSPNESRVLESDFELEGTLMTFKLPNTILKDIFYEIRSDVLELLKRKLHNGNIQIEAIITAEETKMKPRTEQEKFENMAEKNPNLWKLKESLDLDLMF